MDAFFYGTAHFCESLFTVLPHFGKTVNVLFILAGFVGAAGWTIYMIRSQRKAA